MKPSCNFHSSVLFDSKKILIIAPHPDDDVIGCGAFLLYISQHYKTSHISVAYAVDGANGVGDAFFQKSGINSKAEIRKCEAQKCCDFLNTQSIYWNLPFYNSQTKKITEQDILIVKKTLYDIQPDIVLMIDEASDPHGTHGCVQDVCTRALQSYTGNVFGYRVWGDCYLKNECDIVFEFDDAFMKQKEQLILFHISQIEDPAFPHKEYGFVELAKLFNQKCAKEIGSEFLYAETFRKLFF